MSDYFSLVFLLFTQCIIMLDIHCQSLLNFCCKESKDHILDVALIDYIANFSGKKK